MMRRSAIGGIMYPPDKHEHDTAPPTRVNGAVSFLARVANRAKTLSRNLLPRLHLQTISRKSHKPLMSALQVRRCTVY